MALNNSKCNHLMPLHFKGLIGREIVQGSSSEVSVVFVSRDVGYFLLPSSLSQPFTVSAAAERRKAINTCRRLEPRSCRIRVG